MTFTELITIALIGIVLQVICLPMMCIFCYSLLCTYAFNSSFPSWLSRELRKDIKNKKKAHRTWKCSNLQRDFLNFSHLRSLCKELVKHNFVSQTDRLESNIPHNAKVFWGYVNSKRGDTFFPTRMHLNDESEPFC